MLFACAAFFSPSSMTRWCSPIYNKFFFPSLALVFISFSFTRTVYVLYLKCAFDVYLNRFVIYAWGDDTLKTLSDTKAEVLWQAREPSRTYTRQKVAQLCAILYLRRWKKMWHCQKKNFIGRERYSMLEAVANVWMHYMVNVLERYQPYFLAQTFYFSIFCCC